MVLNKVCSTDSCITGSCSIEVKYYRNIPPVHPMVAKYKRASFNSFFWSKGVFCKPIRATTTIGQRQLVHCTASLVVKRKYKIRPISASWTWFELTRQAL